MTDKSRHSCAPFVIPAEPALDLIGGQESIFRLFFQRARRTRSSSSKIKQTAPTLMALSAMLNAGKWMPA